MKMQATHDRSTTCWLAPEPPPHLPLHFRVPYPFLNKLPNASLAQDCYMEEHADYDGPAITWGLEYKLASAAQCCQACKDVRGLLCCAVPGGDGVAGGGGAASGGSGGGCHSWGLEQQPLA